MTLYGVDWLFQRSHHWHHCRHHGSGGSYVGRGTRRWINVCIYIYMSLLFNYIYIILNTYIYGQIIMTLCGVEWLFQCLHRCMAAGLPYNAVVVVDFREVHDHETLRGGFFQHFCRHLETRNEDPTPNTLQRSRDTV